MQVGIVPVLKEALMEFKSKSCVRELNPVFKEWTAEQRSQAKRNSEFTSV